MKTSIFKLEVRDDKQKKEVMDTISGISGVDSISIDMKEKKMTVTGDIDPVNIVNKLMNLCHTEIVSVEPAKEPEKKKEDGQKKGNPKEKQDGQMKGYGGVLDFDVETSYDPQMPTYNRSEITKPRPHPSSEDDDACACCACAIL